MINLQPAINMNPQASQFKPSFKSDSDEIKKRKMEFEQQAKLFNDLDKENPNLLAKVGKSIAAAAVAGFSMKLGLETSIKTFRAMMGSETVKATAKQALKVVKSLSVPAKELIAFIKDTGVRFYNLAKKGLNKLAEVPFVKKQLDKFASSKFAQLFKAQKSKIVDSKIFNEFKSKSGAFVDEAKIKTTTAANKAKEFLKAKGEEIVVDTASVASGIAGGAAASGIESGKEID